MQTNYFNHFRRNFTVLTPGAAHNRKPNGILGLLCRTHYPGLVDFGRGVRKAAKTFAHYGLAPDFDATDSRRFNNMLERVLAEFWVSINSYHITVTYHIY